jgi:hypothetical protein
VPQNKRKGNANCITLWVTRSCTDTTHPSAARREEEERVRVLGLGNLLTDGYRRGFESGGHDMTVVADEMATGQGGGRLWSSGTSDGESRCG